MLGKMGVMSKRRQIRRDHMTYLFENLNVSLGQLISYYKIRELEEGLDNLKRPIFRDQIINNLFTKGVNNYVKTGN